MAMRGLSQTVKGNNPAIELKKEDEARLTKAAIRWLDLNSDLTRLQTTLRSRTQTHPTPKVIAAPVYIDLGRLLEQGDGLAEFIMAKPFHAQKIFHHVLHVASVAITLQLRASKEAKDEECTVPSSLSPPLPLLDLAFPASLYSYQELNKKFDGEVTIDKEDLDLTLQSLASHLPLNASIASDSEDPYAIPTSAQLYTPLQVGGVPRVKEWMLRERGAVPLNLQEPTLALVIGRVLSVSMSSTFTKWVRYLCTNPGCVGMARDLHVRVFVMGRPESATVHQRPPCRVCRAPLKEDPSYRELGDRMSVMLIPSVNSGAFLRETPTTTRALKVVLRDDMMHGVEPGQVLEATVMVAPQIPPEFPSLEAIHVYPPYPQPPSTLPPFFKKLLSESESSPWSFMLKLAYKFGDTVTPCGTFHSLKLALLLSLASCSPNKAGLAVLAVGSNTLLLEYLLRWGARYAPHTMIHSSPDPVTTSCKKEADNMVWMQAGSLLLAQGGVCVLGDFSVFKKDARRKVCKALESGTVQAECNISLHHHSGPPPCYPLRAAAWACFDPSSGKASTAMETSDNFLHVPLGDLTKSITDLFGLVVYTETAGGECEMEAEEEIAYHTLAASSCSEPQEPYFPEDQTKQYLRMARGLTIKFSPTAERLIQGYYVASRRLRGDSVMQGSLLPVTAIQTLTHVAASHARLALRTTVESWDAAAAVLLCEEALAAHSGYSFLHVTPTPHLPPNADLEILVSRKSEYMAHFLMILEDFITTHTGDIPGTF